MQQKSVIVLADDRSGACEMAGIALRFGRQAEVQQSFNPGTDVAVIVYNSDTRSRGLPEARQRLRAFCQQLLKQGTGCYFFKKIDSVLRGHIVEEVIALVKAAHERGIWRIVITHAMGDSPGLTLEDMYVLSQYEVFFELTSLSYQTGPQSHLRACWEAGLIY
ncbi:MAG: four-carbon acid sugar kinase family protein [bacterium]|nr:four-carbon acid sugar kinase family protein [bacterium]